MERRLSQSRLAKKTCLCGSEKLLDCGKYHNHEVYYELSGPNGENAMPNSKSYYRVYRDDAEIGAFAIEEQAYALVRTEAKKHKRF